MQPFKAISSGFGLLTVIAIAAGFGFVTAPDTPASIPLPATTTTTAPQATTSTTAVKTVQVKHKAPTATTAPVTAAPTTLATIPQYLVDRIDSGPRLAPESVGMSDEGKRTTTTVEESEQTATDYMEE